MLVIEALKETAEGPPWGISTFLFVADSVV